MTVDSSAVIAILRQEPEAPKFLRAIQSEEKPCISAANYLEAAIVIDASRSPISSRKFDEFITNTGITVEPVTSHQARIAREAYRDFGKGSGHPARLNFGDCFAYALSIDKREPLLFKGTDFGQTDVQIWKPEA